MRSSAPLRIPSVCSFAVSKSEREFFHFINQMMFFWLRQLNAALGFRSTKKVVNLCSKITPLF